MLTIKDLSASKELDTKAMATVRGGTRVDLAIDDSFNYLTNRTDFDNRIQLNAVDQTNLGAQVVGHNYGLVWQDQDFDNTSHISN
jgi:hypothetical protein